jgi:hypothetical protein
VLFSPAGEFAASLIVSCPSLFKCSINVPADRDISCYLILLSCRLTNFPRYSEIGEN